MLLSSYVFRTRICRKLCVFFWPRKDRFQARILKKYRKEHFNDFECYFGKDHMEKMIQEKI